MAVHYKHNRATGNIRKGGQKGKSKREEPTTNFSSSRTRDAVEDEEQSTQSDGVPSQVELSTHEDVVSSSEDEQQSAAQSYASLLKSLKPRNTSLERSSKRRKLASGYQIDHHKKMNQGSIDINESQSMEEEQEPAAALDDQTNEPDDEAEEEVDSEGEDFVLHDPFEQHYSCVVEEELAAALKSRDEKPAVAKTTVGNNLRKMTTYTGLRVGVTRSKASSNDLKLKRRLIETGSAATQNLQEPEQDLLSEIFSYKDILFNCRSLRNTVQLRDLASLHALNHIFKTRDRVLKNNAKLAQDPSTDADFRDQGFTRPKVLVLVPTKQICVRYINSIIKLSQPDQQENKSRFLDTFSQPEDEGFETKPEDFRELFSGNHEEDFRVGLKFTRKTIKFFSGFYNSDMIFASPLGLMRTITAGGGKKASESAHDADFLSSIEIAIMDYANALEMQNWQHVTYVFSQLNLLPKDSHGCDFNRARHWYLDGKAKYLRQTIIFSDYLTPSLSALASTYLHNIAGRVKYTPTYPGAMVNLPPSLPLQLTQTFLRFDSLSPQTDSDSRFEFFTSTILSPLLRSANQSTHKGTLIYMPTYLDFLRLRNHLSTATDLSFGTVSEYASRGDVARARSHFVSGRHSVLLYSERAHHYFRYRLKGVRRLIFYGVPENPIFWGEMVEMLGINAQNDLEWAATQKGKHGKGLVRALFSKWDVLKLERIVGTERVGRLVREQEGDVFEFV